LYGGTHQSEATLLGFLDNIVGEDGVDGLVREDNVEGSLGEDELEVPTKKDGVYKDEETLIIKEMGLTNVNQMYLELDMFMSEKNRLLNPKPFPSLRRLRQLNFEEKL